MFLHLAPNFVTLFQKYFWKKHYMFSKNLFFEKKSFSHHMNIYFHFCPNLAVSCTLNRNITSLRKIWTIWIWRNRAGTFLDFLQILSENLLVIVICNQKEFAQWLMWFRLLHMVGSSSFLGKKNYEFPNFMLFT